jgi:hypothetical protein
MTDKNLPNLFLFGVPGRIGGAATKIAHLIKLLHQDFRITLVVPAVFVLQRQGSQTTDRTTRNPVGTLERPSEETGRRRPDRVRTAFSSQPVRRERPRSAV